MACAACAPDDAAQAFSTSRKLDRGPHLADESHFDVFLLTCRGCGQVWANVFCERIDWAGGNDPQDWLLIPLTAAEAQALSATAADDVEAELARLPGERIMLVRWSPADADAPDARWVTGPIWLPRHD